MLKRLLNSFKPVFIKDAHFGDVEVQQNTHEGTYYLERDFWVDFLSKKIYFTIETHTQQATKFQFDTYVFIQKNFEQLCRLAFEKLQSEFGNKDKELKLEYQVDTFYIPIDTYPRMTFELSLLNRLDGFSRCIVEFEDFKLGTLSFEA